MKSVVDTKVFILIITVIIHSVAQGNTDLHTHASLTPSQVDVEVVDVLVDSEDGLRVQVKLLDCDTVSQVKEKLLDATYKVGVAYRYCGCVGSVIIAIIQTV